MTIRIDSGRLLLEPFSEAHLTARYLDWLNDPETVRYSELRHRRHDRASALDYLKKMRAAPNHFWAIVCHDAVLGHIGNLSAYIDRANGVADMAVMIGEVRARGAGYGREAWQAASDWLLAQPGIRKLTAGTMACNAPMLATMWACGMVEDGRRRGQFLLDGAPVDLVYGARFA